MQFLYGFNYRNQSYIGDVSTWSKRQDTALDKMGWGRGRGGGGGRGNDRDINWFSLWFALLLHNSFNPPLSKDYIIVFIHKNVIQKMPKVNGKSFRICFCSIEKKSLYDRILKLMLISQF
jgi:hypothetical protein